MKEKKYLFGLLFILVAGYFLFGFERDDVNVAEVFDIKDNVEEKVLVRTSKGLQWVNVLTGEVGLYEGSRSELDISGFVGLPSEERTETTHTYQSRRLISSDHGQVIVTFSTYDITVSPSPFDGSLPVLDTQEYYCIVSVKQCSKSNLLKKVEATMRGMIWHFWDSETNQIIGNVSMDGVGNSSPVRLYDVDTQTILETTGYDCLGGEVCAKIPYGAFSPSWGKFVMAYKDQLFLYHKGNIDTPYRIFDLSSVGDQDGYVGIRMVAWTDTENAIAFGTSESIYTLDLKTGTVVKRFTDTTMGKGRTYLSTTDIQFSPSNRFIIFVDYVGYNTGNENFEGVLRGIDLLSGQVIEIASDTFMSVVE